MPYLQKKTLNVFCIFASAAAVVKSDLYILRSDLWTLLGCCISGIGGLLSISWMCQAVQRRDPLHEKKVKRVKRLLTQECCNVLQPRSDRHIETESGSEKAALRILVGSKTIKVLRVRVLERDVDAMPKEKPQVFGLLSFVHCRMNLARGGGGQLLYKKR